MLQPTAQSKPEEKIAPAAPAPEPSLPQARRTKKRHGWIVLAVLLVVGAGALTTGYFVFRDTGARTDLVTVKAEYRNLQLRVVERGTLEAKENHDIKCDVKTGSRGAPKIKWVVEQGSRVNVADLLVDIDDSYLTEQAETKGNDRSKAESDKVKAEQTYPIKKSAIALAEQQLQQWIKGDFPQGLHDIEGKIQINESNVLQQEDRTAWAARMVKKGYMTASQAEAEQASLMSNKLNLQSYQEQKKVLLQYTDPVKRQTLENAIKEAKANERAAEAEMRTFQDVFAQQDKQYKDLLEQIRQCKVYAKNAGIVVYYVPEQASRGMGSQQSIIAQGEPVQYGQKMMSIPDLSHMLVNVRVHEAFINYMKEGLPVMVRVDADGGKTLKAHVKYVASVAASQDWMSPDVKVYPCQVEIDENLTQLKLKPGLSAVCSIFTTQHVEHVLAVPAQAVVSAMGRGGKRVVYVLTPGGVETREVEMGMTDKEYVEIKSGLNEGDEVVLNPRALTSDKEKKPQDGRNSGKTAPGEAGNNNDAESGKGKRGGKGKGKMAPPE